MNVLLMIFYSSNIKNNEISMAKARKITHSFNRNIDNKVERQGRRFFRMTYCLFLLIVVSFTLSLAILHISSLPIDNPKDDAASQPRLKSNGLSELSDRRISSQFTINTIVLPSVVNPKGRKRRLDSITKTWATLTNAIYVTHPGTDSDYSIPSTSSSKYPQVLLIPPNIPEDQGVPRLQYVIEYVHKEYNPDFCFFANDHTFIIPEHLYKYLDEIKANPEEHLYAGHALRPKNQRGTKFAFNSGASGYFLSRKTMQILTEKWNSGDEVCQGSGRKWLQGNPGLVTAMCLQSIGVNPVDSRDKEKRHIFHAFGFVRVVRNEVDQWYHEKHEDLAGILGEDEKYHHKLQKGEACCSPYTASFHYVEFAETTALWATLQEVQRNPRIDDDALQKYMIAAWPQDKKDVGGYAQHLPPEKKKEVWKDLLQVVRNIAN